jgi:branched-chain amino acid transport system substrate-binding protein
MISRRTILAAGLVAVLAAPAVAQTPFKVGLILPMTGQSQSTGKQIEAAVKLYIAQNGDTVAGRKIEVIVRDDAGVADTTKRQAQELIVRDKVGALAGFGLTPLAMATAPLASQAKVPMIVMAAATSIIPNQSPFIVRSSQVLPQTAVAMAQWAAENGIKSAVTLVSDYAPGIDAETWFVKRFKELGGEVKESLRTPLASPDFAPVLQRAADAKPQAMFVFVPSGQGAAVAKQFAERGLDKSGIRLIGTGDVTDDDQLNGMGDAMLGVVTSGHYSASHPSAANRAFVAAFKAANPGMRPNFRAVAGYDGMHMLYEALRKAGGTADGEALVAAMKGMSFESPRGPVVIDAETRDVVHNIYIRRVERVDGEFYNTEFATIPMLKDPAKAAPKP